MKPSGFIKSARSIVDHPIVGVRNPTYHAAWNWMLHEACFQQSERFVDGSVVTLCRGEFMASLAYMLKALPFFTMKQLRVFLRILSDNGMILVTAGKGHTPNRIFISNYNHHQRDVRGEGQTEGTQRASKGQAKGNNKRKEEGKKVNTTPYSPPVGDADGGGVAFEEATGDQPSPAPKSKRQRHATPESYPADFEAVWRRYPEAGRNGKAASFRLWSRLSDAHRAQLPACIAAYEAKLAKDARKDWTPRPKDFSGFLNVATSKGGSVYADFLDAPVTQSPASAPEPQVDDLAGLSNEQWRGRIAEHAGAWWPSANLGPSPASKACRVPPELVADLKLADKYDAAGRAINRHDPNHPMHRHAEAAA